MLLVRNKDESSIRRRRKMCITAGAAIAQPADSSNLHNTFKSHRDGRCITGASYSTAIMVMQLFIS